VQHKVFTTMTLFGLLILPLAHAQSSRPVRANIPFDFGVQNRVMPAGTYQLTYSALSHGVVIRGVDDNNLNIFVMTYSSTDANRPRDGKGKLVFNRYGGTYFLSQLWQSPGQPDALEVNRTSRERNLAARISAPGVERASIIVPVR
jgi:hypothetical protein